MTALVNDHRDEFSSGRVGRDAIGAWVARGSSADRVTMTVTGASRR